MDQSASTETGAPETFTDQGSQFTCNAPTSVLQWARYIETGSDQLPADAAAWPKLAADLEQIMLTQPGARQYVDVRDLADVRLSIRGRAKLFGRIGSMRTFVEQQWAFASASEPALHGVVGHGAATRGDRKPAARPVTRRRRCTPGSSLTPFRRRGGLVYEQKLEGLQLGEQLLHRSSEQYERVVMWMERDSWDQLVLAVVAGACPRPFSSNNNLRG